jgi:hypothetical protein
MTAFIALPVQLISMGNYKTEWNRLSLSITLRFQVNTAIEFGQIANSISKSSILQLDSDMFTPSVRWSFDQRSIDNTVGTL